jgi:hypothetical protein
VFAGARLFVLPLVAAAFLGCPSAEALEDRVILAALAALRDAPAEDLANRKKLVGELEKKPATSLLARRVRDDCARAYRLLVEGQEATATVTRAMARPGGTTSLLADLARAEEKIRQSEEAMPACEKAAAELRLSRR